MKIDIIFQLWKHGYQQRLHEACIELIKKHIPLQIENYCDLGCGNLEFTKKISNYISAQKNYCLDINNNTEIDYGNFSFKQCDFNSSCLPFSNNSLDFLTCSNVIEHLYNTDNFIKEIYRIMRPGGAVLIITNNISCWTNILSLLFGRQPNAMHASDYLDTGRLFQKDSIRTIPNYQHRRLFGLQALINTCLYHKFINPIGQYCVFYPFIGILERIAEKIFPVYSAYLMVLVWKKNESAKDSN